MAVRSAVLQEAAGRAGLGGDGGLSGGLAGFLSPRERDDSLRFRRPEDRLDYHASHALFRLLAARRLGLRPAAAAGLAVRRICGSCGAADHGKPAIDGVALSMSRSQGTVMAAAGPTGTGLGADIERVPRQVFAGFDEFALAPEERGAPDGPGLPSPQLTNAGRIRWWVAKEAVLKAAGVGLAVPPSSVRLVPAGAGATCGSAGPAGPFLAECASNAAVHGMLVTPVPAPEGYAAAVAASERLPCRAVSLAEIFATKV